MAITHVRNEARTREVKGFVGKPMPDGVGIAWCEKDVTNQWFFMDAAHVLGALQQSTCITPCKLCLKAMRRIIDRELAGEIG